MAAIDSVKLASLIQTSAQETGRRDVIEAADVVALIERYDSNGDLALSRDEFVQGASRQGFSWAGRTLGAAYVYRSDYAGPDGKIDCAEGMAILRRNAKDLGAWYGVKVSGSK